ncbi:hypothetical protein BCV69DRAFT_219650 [Microstroma glucosiphilum]|uniref:AMP-dependent synthetase/ligase domain-containing protein n=1 Tax=Pseudomicrostroma glucosiphilum TaxID=1684307 RepID=A0A316U5I6_9BASI|nr:hypothetical protein BCV69DRAFT_219650 [Pseudomicrostroma glucosiphilum]PWN20104.1 hypothetical protein BCV69DRAFT_219650 [Pseudomicrostroma glucosiphilum]
MAPYEPSITDKYTLSELPQDVIEALDFWAAVTPDQPALKIPRGEIPAEGMATITFFEWMQARNLLAAWLACDLAVGAPGRLGGSTRECTLAFLIAPNHEVINPWFAMAALGFTVQFISPLHTPKIVASLIRASQAHVVLHHSMDSGWIKEVEAMTRESGKPLEFRELSSNQLLVPIVEHFRSESPATAFPSKLPLTKPELLQLML